MILMKLWHHAIAKIKRIKYKIIYGSRVSFGRGVTFRKGFNLLVDRSGKLEIGQKCFFNNGCSINCSKHIKIGSGSIFGENVRVYDRNQCFADLNKSIKSQKQFEYEIKIGSRCWIGSNVVILKGAEIGDDCVIGAGCVISGKVEGGNIVKRPETNVMEPIRGGVVNDLISIIVPVYKIEEILLRRSIESILKQTHSNIEVLMIDDGSPDHCGDVCDEYAKRDSRIQVFHTKNHGVSASRNYALDRATGNYIFFVDGDDYIEEDTLESLLKELKDECADCAMCASNRIEEINMENKGPKNNNSGKVSLTQKEAIEALCYMEQPFDGYELGAIWGCLCKLECIGNIRFKTNMKIGEDFEFKYRFFLNISTAVCLESKLYNYLIRGKSAMRNGFDKSKLDSVKELQSLLISEFALKKYREALRSRICNIAIVVLFMIPTTSEYKIYKKPIKQFLKENRKAVIQNPKSRIKVKAFLCMSYMGFDWIQRVFFFANGKEYSK